LFLSKVIQKIPTQIGVTVRHNKKTALFEILLLCHN
jgi:hypothetical protein